MLRTVLGGAALFSVLSTAACSAPIEGNWISLHKLGNGEHDKLAVNSDKTADATVFATPPNDPSSWTKFVFGAAWQAAGPDFDFDMKCKQGPCNGDDFSMSCEIVDEHNGEVYKLDCKANNKWTNYPFDWQQDI